MPMELQELATAAAEAVEIICGTRARSAGRNQPVPTGAQSCDSNSSSTTRDACVQNLRASHEALEAILKSNTSHCKDEKAQQMPTSDVDALRRIWASAIQLWNLCVSEANDSREHKEGDATAATDSAARPVNAEMRDVACRLLLVTMHLIRYQIPDQSIDFKFVVVEALVKTGRVWHDFKRFEQAEDLFTSASEILQTISELRWEPRCTSMSLECALSRMINLWAVPKPEAARKVEGFALQQALVVAGMSALGVSGVALALHVAFTIYNRAAAVSQAVSAEEAGKQSNMCWPDRNSESLRMLEECQQIVDAVLNGPTAGSLSPVLIQDAKVLKREALVLMAGYLVDRQADGDLTMAKRCLQVLQTEHEDASEELPCTAQVAECLVSLSCGKVPEAMAQMMDICSNPSSQPESIASIIIHALRNLRQRSDIKTDNISGIEFAARSLQTFHQPAQRGKPSKVGCRHDCAQPAARVAIHILAEGDVQDTVEEALALDICRWEAAGCSTTLADALWNRGVQHFRIKRFDKAEPCFQAAADHYSGRSLSTLPSAFHRPVNHHGQNTDPKNLDRAAKSMSTAALCCIGRGAPADAVRLLDVAEKVRPGVVSCAFMRLKALLQLKDSTAAAEQVTRLPSCNGFELEHLRLACQEAQSAAMPDVALAALIALQSQLQNSTSVPDDPPSPGSLTEGAVLRATLQLLTERVRLSCGKLGSSSGDGDGELDNAVRAIDQLGSVVNLACKRLADLGPEIFHGKAAGGKTACAESEWFSRCCWNNAMDAQKYATHMGSYVTWQCCATLWRAAACFLCSSLATDHNSLYKDRHKGIVAYLQAAAAAMEAYKVMPPADKELRAQALTLVQGLLDELQEVAREKIKQPLGETNLLVLHYLHFRVAVGRKDTASIASLLKAAAEIPSATAGWLWCYTTLMNTLMQDGEDGAATPPATLTSLVKMALHLALQKLVGELGASSEVPADAANLFHRLLTWLLKLSLNDQENAKLYGQAADLLETHRSLSQFHQSDTNRLVAQAHNRGIELALQARGKESEDHLQAALRISLAAAGSKQGQADHIRKTLGVIRTSASGKQSS